MPGSASDKGSSTPSRAVTAWTQGLLCVAVVATGVIVNGLLYDPEPGSTAAPRSTTTAPEHPAPEYHSYVTPPVTYPTRISGCATVEPPDGGATVSWVGVNQFGYDNPAHPWFSGPKAMAMSTAVRDALPDGVALDFAPVDESLFFQPISGEPDGSDPSGSVGGSTTAHATLRRGDRAGGWLSVSVRQSSAPVPPCVAGELDERRLLADGTTVDTHDTWSETDGVRTLSRAATAYAPDGSVVAAYATDTPAGAEPTGAVPITVDELVDLVSVPATRITEPVPPGTPDAPESCHVPAENSAAIDVVTAARLDAVLARIPFDGLTLDRPLGALRPGGFGTGGVCQTVRVTTAGQESQLSISITAGPESEPTMPSVDESGTTTVQRLPDGTVVEHREAEYVVGEPGTASAHPSRSVVVTRPSGTRVQVDSTAERAAAALPHAQLAAIALAPGLEVR